MSRFDDAINIVLRHEGGYSCNPNDRGGPTNYGISLRYLIEQVNQDPQFFNENNFHFPKDLTYIDIKKLSVDKTKVIYKKYFWDKGRFDRIVFEPLCFKAFDLSITMGICRAIKLLQKAYNQIEIYKKLEVDGILGPKSAIAINLSPSKLMYNTFIDFCREYYHQLAQANEKDNIFLNGWLNRVGDKLE